jgi:secernin
MCDLLVALPAATASGRTLFAKNSDRPPSEEQVLEWLPPRAERETTTTYLTISGPPSGTTLGVLGSRPAWMWGLEHGVNEAGVAAGNATIYTALDPRGHPDALTGMDLVRLALERATTATDAVTTITDAIERWGQGGSGHDGAARPYWSSFLLADPTSAWLVETSGREIAALAVERSWATSNRTTIPAFDATHRHPRQPVATLVDPRLAASRAVLGAEPVTVDALRRHLASHEGGAGGWTICMHVEGVEETRAAMVAELDPAGPRVWAAAGPPCRSPFVDRPLGPLSPA